MTRTRFVVLLPFALIGCRHALPVYTEVRPEQACSGQLVLEFTNHLVAEVEVGWLPIERREAAPGGAAPLWLGVLGRGSARYQVPGPGRVIFRTANPAGTQEDRHEVTHRLLCHRSLVATGRSPDRRTVANESGAI